MSSPRELVDEICRVLAANADPVKAEPMQAYMKSGMPFRGIQAGHRRKLCRAVFVGRPLLDSDAWRSAILTLWRNAEYREERYAALDLAGYRRYRPFRTIECLPMYEEMIVSGAWWDFVDELAIRHVGALLEGQPELMEPILRSWSIDADLWKRRASIICQVSRHERTDAGLLSDCILPSLNSKVFFLRKAIGWALRAYSRSDAAFVRAFVESHEDCLSGLSRKEALRRISEE